MDESAARTWDVGIKLAGLLGIAIGAGFSYFQYFDGVKRQETTALIEAQKPFLTERQELYAQATRAVAELATSESPTVKKEAAASFWALYWGPLATVESRDVESLMVQIGACLQRGPDCSEHQLRVLSLNLAQTVRAEAADAWNVYLPRLQEK